MASLLKNLCMFIWLHLASQGGSATVAKVASNGTLHIDGSSPIATTDEDFICATIDWWPQTRCEFNSCIWGNSSLLNIDLSNKYLLNAIQAFSPLKLRLGGTLQDRLVYQTVGDQRPCTEFVRNELQLLGFTQGCLPMARWDQLNKFFKRAGATIIFGLNALSGKEIGPHGDTTGAWDSSNAEHLMNYSVVNGYHIHGWELGNELSGGGVGARIPSDQYASDVISLQTLVQKIYKADKYKPLVAGPGGFLVKDWFKDFVNKSGENLQVVTHHIYNLGRGDAPDLVEKILNPSYLDGTVAQVFRDLQNILKSTGNSTVAWVSESGGAYWGGQNLVTNAFVFSFWYLDQLGMSSTYDTKTYCRQSLIGGNYGLLDTDSYLPNPDFFSALLWARLMGKNVLSTSFDGSKNIRAYAHCSKNTVGVTLLLINLDNSTSFQVDLSIVKSGSYTDKYGNMRDEYLLTPKDGKLRSRTMLLNGKVLSVNSTGLIPALEPKRVNASEPIIVYPWSILFAQIPSIEVPACK